MTTIAAKIMALEQDFAQHQALLQRLDADRARVGTRLVELQGALAVLKELQAEPPEPPEVPVAWASETDVPF